MNFFRVHSSQLYLAKCFTWWLLTLYNYREHDFENLSQKTKRYVYINGNLKVKLTSIGKKITIQVRWRHWWDVIMGYACRRGLLIVWKQSYVNPHGANISFHDAQQEKK